MDWTKRHTYYTQYLCRRVFANGTNKVNLAEVKMFMDLEKELLLEELSPEGHAYCVYNVFHSRWLES